MLISFVSPGRLARITGTVPTGISGFDDITSGRLPRGRVTLLSGGPGAGKTVFALASLVHGARADVPGPFIAFDEDARRALTDRVLVAPTPIRLAPRPALTAVGDLSARAALDAVLGCVRGKNRV